MTELLRLATAGSVDDGKSTLIGRLLYDAKGIFEDQLEAIRRTSEQRGNPETDLALLTDGLRAEREQGITIDVAYRYFATPRRKFIIADTPGHTEYTRNMVTGASNAHVSLILVDARKGVIEQTRRHAFLSSMLGVPHMVVCVNKMDLIDWDQERYERIKSDFMEFAARLNVHDITFIPISALRGDNVVQRSENMWWYDGTPLLNHLESVYIGSDENFIDPRFPVQYVIRSQTPDAPDFRGYAGTVASGVLRPGDDVLVLPSGTTSRIASIMTADGEVAEAYPPMAVVVTLTDDIAVSRGDVLCRPNNRPDRGHGHRGHRVLDGRARLRWPRAAPTCSSRAPARCGRRCSPCSTDSTSTACTATRRRRRWRSTRSAVSRSAAPSHSWWTTTRPTGPPAASSSSTPRPTARSGQGSSG